MIHISSKNECQGKLTEVASILHGRFIEILVQKKEGLSYLQSLKNKPPKEKSLKNRKNYILKMAERITKSNPSTINKFKRK